MSSDPSPHVPLGEETLARAALTYLAEPADPALGALLAICSPAEVLAAIKADMLPGTGPGCGDTPASRAALGRALGRWRARLPGLPDDDWIAGARRDGIRLICPGDAEWPGALDQLAQARPYALWLRGNADLRFASSRSVSMVGSRAATGYGGHVAGEMAADLGERGWAVVSGGAYETKSQWALACFCQAAGSARLSAEWPDHKTWRLSASETTARATVTAAYRPP